EMSFATLSSMMPNTTSIAYLQTQLVSDINPRLADSAKSLAFCLTMVASVEAFKVFTRAFGNACLKTAPAEDNEEEEEEEFVLKRGRRMERRRL
ncbi:hypothetical protein FRB90_002985, partial [Tulasnella sp. 427]